MSDDHDLWIAATTEMIRSHRRMIDAAITQLSDQEMHMRPSPDMNSVAVILRHLAGNLQSRWTDFLTTDGEKPTRDRDAEFQDWDGDRASLIDYFDAGWQLFTATILSLQPEDMTRTVLIRGEAHSVPKAIIRGVTHVAYHAGQIMQTARAVHQGEWQWLTIAPGQSQQHNASTWGTGRSRGGGG